MRALNGGQKEALWEMQKSEFDLALVLKTIPSMYQYSDKCS